MSGRVVVRLELTRDAKRRLDHLTGRMGMTQVALTSRLVTWFASQPEAIQAAILGHYPEEIEPDVARLILRRMAEGDET